MVHRRVVVFASLVWTLLMAVPALASVVGKWSVSGPCSLDATMPGIPPVHEKVRVKDKFTFDPGGKFHMIGIDGNWRMKSGRFVIYLSAADIETFLEDMLAGEGIDSEVDVQSIAISGTEVGSKIKGTFAITADLYLPKYTRDRGTINVLWSFTGKKISSSEPEGDINIDKQEPGQSMQEKLTRTLVEVLSRTLEVLPDAPTDSIEE